MSYLFTDPIAQVMAVDMDTGKIWSLTSPETPFVTSVSFQYVGRQGAENSFSVGVDIPYEYAIRWMEWQDTPFKAKNLIRARIGYASGGWTQWVYGNLSNGGAGLSLTADGLSGTMTIPFTPMKAASYTISKDILKAAGYDAKKLISLVCENMGIGTVFSEGAESSFAAWKLPANMGSSKTGDDFIGGLEGKDTMSVIGTLCSKCGCKSCFKSKDGKKYIHIHTEKEMLDGLLHSASDSNVRKYILKGLMDQGVNQYPMFSISPGDGDASSWTTGVTSAASGYFATGQNTDTGEDVVVKIEPEKDETPGIGNVAVTSPKEQKITFEMGETVFADIDKKDGRLGTFMSASILPGGDEIFKLQAKSFGQVGNPGLKMEITTLGLPDEEVGNLCQVWGCGSIYNDLYYIESLTHSWTPGNWEMTLGLWRKGLRALAGESKPLEQMKDPKSQ